MPGKKTDRGRIERMARMCNDNTYAAQTLGISRGTFGRLCREYGIETPNARSRRRIEEARNRNRAPAAK